MVNLLSRVTINNFLKTIQRVLMLVFAKNKQEQKNKQNKRKIMTKNFLKNWNHLQS